MRQDSGGPIYTATFSNIAVSAAQDLFELVAPASTRLELLEVKVGQESDEGDAAAEMLPIQIIRGYTTSGSGGASVTPGKVVPWQRDAVATVERNNTTVAQDGTGVILDADTFNIMGGWRHYPAPEERIGVEISTRLVVRLPVAPADAVTMYGTIKWKEIGKFAST